MEEIKNNFDLALKQAKSLEQDSKTDIYQFFNSKPEYMYYAITSQCPIHIFESVFRSQRTGSGGYYIAYKMVNNKPEKVLMFHKKYSRKDIVVTSVSFEIVGLKRKSQHLPAGVIVTNIKFIH